jgi:hypothetical protein
MSLFIFRHGQELSYILMYVDDIVITALTDLLLQRLTQRPHSVFAMTDLGALSYFLGISTQTSSGMVLSQRQHTLELLQRAGMVECNPCATAIDVRCKLSATEGSLLADPTEYQRYAGALQYLTLTRPDIAHAI